MLLLDVSMSISKNEALKRLNISITYDKKYCKCKYSILPKIRQILFPWDYELTEKDFF